MNLIMKIVTNIIVSVITACIIVKIIMFALYGALYFPAITLICLITVLVCLKCFTEESDMKQ